MNPCLVRIIYCGWWIFVKSTWNYFSWWVFHHNDHHADHTPKARMETEVWVGRSSKELCSQGWGLSEALVKTYGKPMGNQRKPMENQWKSGFTRDLEKLEWNIKKICWTYLEIGFVCPQDHQAWWASMILPSRMWIWWQPHGIPPGIWDFSAPGIFGFIMIDQQVFVNTIHNWWLIRLSVSGWLTQGPTYKCGISRVFLHLLPSGYD